MTAESLRDELLARRISHTGYCIVQSKDGHPDAVSCVCGYARDIDALIQAVRAEEAAKGLIDAGRLWDAIGGIGVLHGGAWVTFSPEDADRIAALYNAALTPTPPPPAATVDRCA
jgi:hypothetical protein